MSAAGEPSASLEPLLEQAMHNLSDWTVIQGSEPAQASPEGVASAPVMRLNNGLIAAPLSREVPGDVDWTVSFEVLPTAFERSGWVGLFDAERKNGFAVQIRSATEKTYGGMGFLMLYRVERDRPISTWQESRKIGGKLLDRAPTTGHNPNDGNAEDGVLSPPLIAVTLGYHAENGLLTLTSNGAVVAEAAVDPLPEGVTLRQLLVTGNTSIYYDNIGVRAALPPVPAQASEPVEPMAELDVRDFGARGDGTHNDAPAFRDALAQLAEIEGPTLLHVPAGEYYLDPAEQDAGSPGHVNIHEHRDLTVRGEAGTMLLFGSPFHHGIVVSASQNVRLESLAVDYRPLPFTQGTIVEAVPEANSFVVELDEGYPRVTDAHMTGGRIKNVAYLFHPRSGHKLNEFYDQYLEEVRQLDPTHALLRSRNVVKPDFVGQKVVMVGRHKADAVVFDASDSCTADRITIHSAPALGFGLRNTNFITIQNCLIRQKTGTDRLLSTNADGIHVKWGQHGPTIVNNWLEGMGDDSVNIGGTYQRVLAQPDARTLIVESHRSLVRGNQIVLVRNRTGHTEPLGNRIETKFVQWDGGPAVRLSFAEDLPTVERTLANGTFEDADLVINMDEVASNAVIRNNFFGRHRVRGVLMRGHGALIEGNRFEDLLGPAIQLGHHYKGRKEGPNGSHTVIRNNTFTNIGRSVIALRDHGPRPESGQVARSIEGVRIVDNRFVQYGKPSAHGHAITGNVMLVDNAEDVLIERNWIDAPHLDAPETPRVVIDQAADVTIRGMYLLGQPTDPESWLETTDRAELETIRVDP